MLFDRRRGVCATVRATGPSRRASSLHRPGATRHTVTPVGTLFLSTGTRLVTGRPLYGTCPRGLRSLLFGYSGKLLQYCKVRSCL